MRNDIIRNWIKTMEGERPCAEYLAEMERDNFAPSVVRDMVATPQGCEYLGSYLASGDTVPDAVLKAVFGSTSFAHSCTSDDVRVKVFWNVNEGGLIDITESGAVIGIFNSNISIGAKQPRQIVVGGKSNVSITLDEGDYMVYVDVYGDDANVSSNHMDRIKTYKQKYIKRNG